ncbi:MAG: alpha/beta fold hydrolase [Bacteroidetes bacterium]|nr:alpha/beta fold hydrolase [Bacteroidota bacterium]
MRSVIFSFVLLASLSSVTIAQDAKEKAFVARARQFFDLLEAKKYDECLTLCDSSLIKVLPAEKIKQNWEPIRASMGKMLERTGELYEDKKSYVLVYVGAKYEKEAMDLKIAFNPQMKIIGFFKNAPMSKSAYHLPTYARPDRTVEEPITIVTDSFKLPGILCLPKGVAHPPVVVMVAGSGPNDRDETVGQNKPFKDIAYGLAAVGIASIRYDKRTMVYGATSSSSPNGVTPDDEVVNDALSALKLARANAALDPKKIFVLGHSLGAMMAPRIAERDGHLSGVIMLAAPARPFQDVLLDQMEFLLPQQTTPENAKTQLEHIRSMVETISKHAYTASTPPAQLFGLPPAYWEYLSKYDQVNTAVSLREPILYLQGGKDYQVNIKDFSVWQRKFGAKQNAELKLFGTLYHLFMPGKGTFTDYDVPGNVSEDVVAAIVSWIKRQ